MRRSRPGTGPAPVPRRTSFVPFASLSAAFARAAAASIPSARAIVGAAATAKVDAVTIPVSKLRRETKCPVLCIVFSSGYPVDRYGHTPVVIWRAFRCSCQSPPPNTRGGPLCDADAGHSDLLEQVRGSDGRGGIGRQFCPELRMRECGPELGGRLPDRIVEVRWTFADRAVKLGGDEARLALHEDGIVLPSFEKGLLVGFIQRKHVHQYDGAGIDRDLTFDREGGVERAQRQNEVPYSIWFHGVDLVR